NTSVSTITQTTFSEINFNNQIEEHIENLKKHISSLKEVISTAKEHFNICHPDTKAIQTLLQAIDDINFDFKNFDKQDQDNIRLFTLKQNLSQKPNKTDLIQLKISLDNQIKQLIELNKQNAKELERIRLIKTSTCETRHIQTILSSNPSAHYKKQTRACSYQSSRPYVTFELDDIRKYQRQALLKSPYGTIPLYRRQAWVEILQLNIKRKRSNICFSFQKAAANLFHDHPLHLLRHMQNSLRMQIHHLLGYDPSDICNRNRKKNINKKSNIEIFNTSQDISIVGNNNKLYRGRIDSCQIIPLKTTKEKKSKIKTNINENNEIMQINFDQLDLTNKTIADEHLFEYLDWQTQFNEQDLPDELCEELFHHWKSIIFEDRSCICKSKSKLILSQEIDNQEHNLINTQIDSSTSSLKEIYDDRCICSDCTCNCEKYENDESICICSQCSCECLKDFRNENQDHTEDLYEICEQNISFLQTDNNSQDHLTNEINIHEKFQLIPTDQVSNVEQIQENDEKDKIIISDCFINRIDRWTQQFDLFQDTYQSFLLPERNNCSTLNDSSQSQIPASIAFRFNIISNPLELDDPTLFRQRILDHH
ncbi:unnamed protein product, partial [Rotaria sp. Silwood2]